VVVLVEERNAARKDLSAKDLKIEMLTTQQGELDLAAQSCKTSWTRCERNTRSTQMRRRRCCAS
jgi:hypothetical protein